MSKVNIKEDALKIFHAALKAVEPGEAVLRSLSRAGEILRIVSGKKVIKRLGPGKIDKIYVIGAGKASAPMAAAIEHVMGKRLAGGVVLVKTGHGLKLNRIEVLEASQGSGS